MPEVDNKLGKNLTASALMAGDFSFTANRYLTIRGWKLTQTRDTKGNLHPSWAKEDGHISHTTLSAIQQCMKEDIFEYLEAGESV